MDLLNNDRERSEDNPSTSTGDETNLNDHMKEESSTLDQQPEISENTNAAATNETLPPLKAEQVTSVPSPRKPFFNGRGPHPLTFLEDLKKYLNVMNTSPNDLNTVLECFTGNAKNWTRIYADKWKTFDQFESDFLQQYWGRGVQSTIKRRLINGCWNRYRNKSMTEYFAHWYCQAKDLTFYSSEEDIVFDIMQHYPHDIRRIWVVSKDTGAEATMKLLRKIEESADNFPGTMRRGRKATWNTGAAIFNARNPPGPRNQQRGGKMY